MKTSLSDDRGAGALPVKIVATIGPASKSRSMIEGFLRAGTDVFRLNSSHGTFEWHRRIFKTIREASSEHGRPVGVLLDLPGPKVRLGTLPKGKLILASGQSVVLSPRGGRAAVPVDLPELPKVVLPGDHIMMSDGNVELEVEEITESGVRCRVLAGGVISSRKGVTLPSDRWVPPAMTEADKSALALGLSLGVDYVAQSFVNSSEDIRAARDFLSGSEEAPPLIAKIETRRALDNIDSIAAESDGIMAARGDLGVELPPEEIPLAQKKIISRARAYGKPVIIATQMLGSMTASPRPTRAETTDVAGAVWSGVDAVMLSDETAVGLYPLKAVSTMARIIEAASRESPGTGISQAVSKTAEAIAHAACLLADDLGADAIVAATESGFTAQSVSRFRPACPIIGLTPNRTTARRLSLIWGVTPAVSEIYMSLDDMVEKAVHAALSLGLAKRGSRLVCTAGLPFNKRGGTDLIRAVSIE